LAGTSWVLATLNGQPALANTVVTLTFGEDGQISGSDGCNSYSAPYTADATNLVVRGPGVTTMMACTEPIMQQAMAFQTALGQTATYTLAGEELALIDGSGQTVATFTAQRAVLTGVVWEVLSYNNGQQAVVSVLGGTLLTAVFGADGSLTGSAGCNSYTASYQSGGQQTPEHQSITIGPVATTRRMCAEPPGIMEQESQYLAALATAAIYRLEGARLDLRTVDGALAATYQMPAQ
jgi:heat shock protein HslJ